MKRPLVDNRLQFDKETHGYKLDGEPVDFVSVTTWIGEHNPPFKPFNAPFWSNKKATERQAKGEDITAEGVKNEWYATANKGSDTHSEIENYIQCIKSIDDAEDKKAQWGCVAYDKLMARYDPITILAEHKVYSKDMRGKDLGIAGTMDLLMLCPDGAVIVDWKTNKQIYKKKDSTVDVESFKLLSGDTYSKYLMQLNTYAFLLQQEHGIKVKALKLVHLKDDGYEILDLPVMLHLVEEMANGH